MTSANGMLFFTADDGVHGNELWKSDGTTAGTVMVADINPGSSNSNPANLTDVNGTLFFSANDGTHGTELWKSDGTAAGTVMVADINPGSGSSYPYALTNVNGALFFSAEDGTHGFELWKSDGTAAGTVMVADINPGSGSSSPFHLTNMNRTLFFVASPDGKSYDGKLYYLAPPLVHGDFNGDGHFNNADLQALLNILIHGSSSGSASGSGSVSAENQSSSARGNSSLGDQSGTSSDSLSTENQSPQSDTNLQSETQLPTVNAIPADSAAESLPTEPIVKFGPPSVTTNSPATDIAPSSSTLDNSPTKVPAADKNSGPIFFGAPDDFHLDTPAFINLAPHSLNLTPTFDPHTHYLVLATVDQLFLTSSDYRSRHRLWPTTRLDASLPVFPLLTPPAALSP